MADSLLSAGRPLKGRWMEWTAPSPRSVCLLCPPIRRGLCVLFLCGDIITQRQVARWDGTAACPECLAADEDLEHRLWVYPAWDKQRHYASRVHGWDPVALRAVLPPLTALTGLVPTLTCHVVGPTMRLWEEALPARRGLPLARPPGHGWQLPFPQAPVSRHCGGSGRLGAFCPSADCDGGPPPQTAQRAEVAAHHSGGCHGLPQRRRPPLCSLTPPILSLGGTGGELRILAPLLQGSHGELLASFSRVAPAHLQVL